jgi:hypothetical protein
MARRTIVFSVALLLAVLAPLARDGAEPAPDEGAQTAGRSAPAPSAGDASRNRGLFYAGLGTGVAGLAVLVGGAAMHDDKTVEDCRSLSRAGVYFYAADCAILGMGSAVNGATKDLVTIGGGAVMAVGATMAMVGTWRPPGEKSTEPRAAAPRAKGRTASVSPSSDIARIVF